MTDIDPPFGYKWTKSIFSTEILDGQPHVNGKKIPFFDGSSLIESITPNITTQVDSTTYKLIIDFYLD